MCKGYILEYSFNMIERIDPFIGTFVHFGLPREVVSEEAPVKSPPLEVKVKDQLPVEIIQPKKGI